MICVIPTTPKRNPEFVAECYRSACKYFSDVLVVCNDLYKGQTINSVLPILDHEYVCICDDDDIILPGIEHAKKMCGGNDVVFGNFMINEHDAINTGNITSPGNYNHRGLIIWRTDYLREKKFASGPVGADSELFLMALASNPRRVTHVNVCTHYYRQHSAQCTQQPDFADKIKSVRLLSRIPHKPGLGSGPERTSK